MKLASRFLIIALVSLLPLKSQAQWTLLPTGTTDNFFNMVAVGDQTLFGFGYTVVKSTDGGNSWNVLSTNTVSSWINTGFFVDSLTGWIGGKYGLVGGEILKTSDGGQSWTSQDTVLDIGINDFHFLNAQEGWAASFGGKVLHTANGGDDWTQITDLGEEIENIQFVDPLKGWAAAYSGVLYHTTDGGYNWSSDVIQRGYGLFFLSPTMGWITGKDGEIYKTTDAGSTWIMQNTGYNKPLFSIYFADALNGWAVGGVDCRSGSCIPFQKIIATTDGGQSWFSQSSNGDSLPQFNNVCFGSTAAYACGNDGQIIKLQTLITQRSGERQAAGLDVFPNPIDRTAILNLPSDFKEAQVKIFSGEGKLVFEECGVSGQHLLQMAHLAPGIYFLQVESGSSRRLQKILKR